MYFGLEPNYKSEHPYDGKINSGVTDYDSNVFKHIEKIGDQPLPKAGAVMSSSKTSRPKVFISPFQITFRWPLRFTNRLTIIRYLFLRAVNGYGHPENRLDGQGIRLTSLQFPTRFGSYELGHILSSKEGCH